MRNNPSHQFIKPTCRELLFAVNSHMYAISILLGKFREEGVSQSRLERLRSDLYDIRDEIVELADIEWMMGPMQ